jgi:hypothetical protein
MPLAVDKKISMTVVLVGVVLFAIGLVVMIRAPSHTGEAHRQTFMATGLMALGVFVTFAGVILSPGLRRWQNRQASETAAAMARGVKAGLGSGTVESRLAALDDLRAKGLVTPEEYQDKRAQILAQL